MSKNLDQIFIGNPITSNASTDLMYFMQSPYNAGTDAGMTYANFSLQFLQSNPTANALLYGQGTNIAGTITLTNGQLAIGSTGAAPTAATLTAGTGINVTNAAGSITIASTGAGLSWSSIAGTTQAAAINNGYVPTNGSLTTITLPATAALGSVIAVAGEGTGGWKLAANTGQTIKVASTTTSSGGSLSSNTTFDSIYVVCVVANTTWVAITAITTGFTVL